MFEDVKAIYGGHHGDRLLKLPSNAARATYCADRAMEWRVKYWDGQAEQVQRAIWSDDTLMRRGWFGRRSRMYPDEVLKAIGQKRWSNSALAKDCVSQEQMWTRFADHFLGLTQLDIPRTPRPRAPIGSRQRASA